MPTRAVLVPGPRRPWTLQATAAGLAAATLLALVAASMAPDGPRPVPGPDGPGGPPASGPAGPPPTVPERPGPALRFGLDADSLALQQAQGVAPDYATIWIGVWNLEKGWGGPAAQLASLREAGITPALHLYYWGDDLSPGCLADGCNGKSRAGWDLLAEGLVAQLDASLGGGPATIVLETEFNKASVARHEPLDLLLAEKAATLKREYPAARVVLGVGGWHPPAWETWDRAAAASDAVGLQALAGAPATAAVEEAPRLFADTLAGARHLRDLFGKPVVLHDVAAPSGPAPGTPATQEATLAPFVANLAELKAAGVDTILYRSFVDHPGAPPASYFGEAERHFGLAAAGTGELKPSGEAWVGAMRAEQAGADR